MLAVLLSETVTQVYPKTRKRIVDASSQQPLTADIMIVDDTPADLSLLTRILNRPGYEVRAFEDGEAALAAAEMQPPDLILLDIVMPVLDGYKVCERLKATEHTQHVPIIFLSALNHTDDILHAFQVGGVDYISKPFHPEEVWARVETHLKIQELRRQLQAANHSLQARNIELQLRNDELDAFAQTVAHDLKNPLGVIVGYASMLVDHYPSMSEPDRTTSAGAIVKASQKLITMVDDLLLLARVHSSEVKLSPLNTASIVQQALDRIAIPLKEVRAQVILPADWPNAMGYAPWVEEIWVNYLSNGLKYGGYPPCLELGGETLPNGIVRYWISDNGQGLDDEQQSSLFLPFTRLQSGKVSGQGLGLSIVRRIVEKLGGIVGVESQPGGGSKFYFTLPAVQVQSENLA